MSFEKVKFLNSDDQELSARLEVPSNQAPHSYAIFAHCFTCNKNLTAVRNISRAMNAKGIAVLRFDFTGLGESEGDFEETNFSSNVADLVCAANFLKENYKAPSLLVGHSLGGAAVIFAASQLDEVLAVATVGAPSSPAHVQHLFNSGIDEIKKTGKAKITIGGRPFTIKKDFLDDIESKSMETTLKNLRKPILILHSPQDDTVGVQNAQELYLHAHHPKSFISLDKADHLLSRKEDSDYVGNVIAGWAARYLEIPKKDKLSTPHQVAVSIGNEGYTSEIVAGDHHLVADEPESLGGNDFGPSPYEYLSSGLGACTVITMKMYAARKNWDIQKIIVHVDHEKMEDTEPMVDNIPRRKIDFFKREIEIIGDLDEKQRERLLQIADKCPVHRTLKSEAKIETILKA